MMMRFLRILLSVIYVWNELPMGSGFECDFTDPACGWSWSEGLVLLSAENSSLFGATAPGSDAGNDTKGQFLYYSAKVAGGETKLEVISPEFEAYTDHTCVLELALHMYNMDVAIFKVIIKAPNNNTWEITSFLGNSYHKWDRLREAIGQVSQPFHVILEVICQNTAVPSHVAIDDLRIVDCYERTEVTTECTPRQSQCSDLVCIDAKQICNIQEDCPDGEDEQKGCDLIPKSAYCNFEEDICGWNNSDWKNSMWIRHSGESPNPRTGPSFDHTYRNRTGVYMLAKFPRGRSFGESAILKSPFFNPPPFYHRNVHSLYYNSCQVRFFFHQYGPQIGDLRLYSLEKDPPSSKLKDVELWRSYGNKDDAWLMAVVPLPNISHKFQLEFSASRGLGHSDIAIDDISLSPECFGIGVPENESLTPPPGFDDDGTPPDEKKPTEPLKRFVFGTCGAKGRLGPTQEQCSLAYRNTSIDVIVGTEPTMKSIQKWIVPEDGIYTMFVKGAGGGTGLYNRGNSSGSFVRATFHWSKGEEVYLLIGQKGTDACSKAKNLILLGLCETASRMRRDISKIRKLNRKREEGGGGGGGGATYVFMIDSRSDIRIPLAIAGGGGGMSASIGDDPDNAINPNGLGLNNSLSPINGFSEAAAGGGGGWEDTTTNPTSGKSLREGGEGGQVCPRASIWETHGGFGGGGGGCAAGGGGGGYTGGDASQTKGPTFNGYGGTSYLSPDAIRPYVRPGSNVGDGSVVVIPAQAGCGCKHLCVLLDIENTVNYCICPDGETLDIDGSSCNGRLSNEENRISPKIWVVTTLCAIVAIAIFVICAHFGMSRIRKRQAYGDSMSHEPLNNDHEGQLSRLRTTGGMVTEYNPNYEFGGSTCSAQDLREIPREQLTLVKALGQGAFGEVYQGYLTNPADNTERPVAVKTLPELSSSQAEMDFLMEALIMSKFNHPNIVTFLGVCFEKMPRFIVLELLPGGDLKSFLREHRPKPQKPSTLTLSDLLKLAMDVAKGCQYLEDNHFIHRDIAARNCLLTGKDVTRVVKIADFGMARDIYRADYYRKGGKAMLPVKWMPPEAFLDGIFTTKTDVWSFGVLLWEVISLGYMPYPGRGNQEVMQLVTSGGRLEPPTNCPSPVYHIMMQCWHPLPNERPNFNTIIERLGYCLQDPDVINAPLPVFHRPPSMERDATVMRPAQDDSTGCCLQVQRPEPGSLLSPGSEDYMIPTPRSMYSMATDRSDLQSSTSLGSSDQLLEMSDRRNPSPSSRPSTWETNFTSAIDNAQSEGDGTTDDQLTPADDANTALKKRAGGYTEVPTSEGEAPLNGPKKYATRTSSVQSVEELPIAPEVSNENDVTTSTTTTANSIALDPAALAKQMSSGDNVPRRYINVDVNCNTGDSSTRGCTAGTTDQSNRNVLLPLDGYAGVNPVA